MNRFAEIETCVEVCTILISAYYSLGEDYIMCSFSANITTTTLI